MKAKREFYMYGNAQKFHDDYIVSLMTGEPMPRKWQQFMELTPEEKARWDASLRLDAEYRIAEAQGFPNGIPGGKTRGNALYTFTQMEEERERNLLKNQIEETLNPYGQYFSPYKTDIHDNAIDMFGNITPADNLWQDPFDTWKNNLTASISAPQPNNPPPLDPLGLRQAIQRLTESVRASMNRANQETQTPVTENANTASTEDAPLPTTYNNPQTMQDPLESWEKDIENKINSGDLVIYGDGEIVTKEEAEARRSSGLQLLGEIETGETPGISPVNAFAADAAYDPNFFNEMQNAVLSDNTANRLRAEYPKTYDFLSTLINEYGMDLATKLPVPLQVKAAIVVAAFAKTMLEIAITVKDRRDKEITRLTQLKPQPYSHKEAVYIANTQVDGWLLKTIGEELVKDMMSRTMNELKIPPQAQHYIIATWETFVNDQKRRYQSKSIY